MKKKYVFLAALIASLALRAGVAMAGPCARDLITLRCSGDCPNGPCPDETGDIRLVPLTCRLTIKNPAPGVYLTHCACVCP
jgi:hypothetical protein